MLNAYFAKDSEVDIGCVVSIPSANRFALLPIEEISESEEELIPELNQVDNIQHDPEPGVSLIMVY